MNPCIKNLNRIEFLITLACTGRCKHCSEGEHTAHGAHIDGDAAARAVRRLCAAFDIDSLMTFGGEPLLHADTVCKIHSAARDLRIPKRQLITNGFFSRDADKIAETAARLAQSGVNEVLLSVDAFHQETIPLEPVKAFAEAICAEGVRLRVHPAWLVNPEHENPYNAQTAEILTEFAAMGIPASSGNIIFPSGNARKYLSAYFSPGEAPVSPYKEDPTNLTAVCISPNGDVLGGNILHDNILDILERYRPAE